MKKLLVMAAMVLSSVGAFAQYSAGDITIQPKIGLNIASVGGDVDGDYKTGLAVGAEATISPLSTSVSEAFTELEPTSKPNKYLLAIVYSFICLLFIIFRL